MMCYAVQTMIAQWLLPAWILVAWGLRVWLRPSLPGRVGLQPLLGIGLYGMVRLGLRLMHVGDFHGASAVAGATVFVLGVAGSFGWAASSGGLRFLYTPIGAATGHWPRTPGAASGAGLGTFWDRGSWLVAGAVLAVDLLVITVVTVCFDPWTGAGFAGR